MIAMHLLSIRIPRQNVQSTLEHFVAKDFGRGMEMVNYRCSLSKIGLVKEMKYEMKV